MTSSNFDDVGDFHRKFDLVNTPRLALITSGPRQLSDAELKFRLKFLREELKEIEAGYKIGDLHQVFDGLIDLVYVAMGTAHMHRMNWQEGWNIVQTANMAKIRAADHQFQKRRSSDKCGKCELTANYHSKRGSTLDVVKPTGWTAPNLLPAFVPIDYGFDEAAKSAKTRRKQRVTRQLRKGRR